MCFKKLRVELYKLTASTNPDSTGQQENTVPNWPFQHQQNTSTEHNPVTPYPILAAPKHCQNYKSWTISLPLLTRAPTGSPATKKFKAPQIGGPRADITNELGSYKIKAAC